MPLTIRRSRLFDFNRIFGTRQREMTASVIIVITQFITNVDPKRPSERFRSNIEISPDLNFRMFVHNFIIVRDLMQATNPNPLAS